MTTATTITEEETEALPPKEHRNTGKQITCTGKIKEGRGGEIITFVINMDLVAEGTKKLVCIVNVPDEGRSKAPVYVQQAAE